MGKSEDCLSNRLIDDFTKFGQKIGFSEVIVTSDHYYTDVYIFNDLTVQMGFAVQMEIDQREFGLFVFLVRIINGKIPDKHIIYKYDDDTCCRKYIEEVYKIKNPIYAAKKKIRYTEEFLFCMLDFYKQLIESNPKILYEEIKKF